MEGPGRTGFAGRRCQAAEDGDWLCGHRYGHGRGWIPRRGRVVSQEGGAGGRWQAERKQRHQVGRRVEPSKVYLPGNMETYADGPMKGQERGEVKMGMSRHLGLEHLSTIAPGVQELCGKKQYTPFDELPLWKKS